MELVEKRTRKTNTDIVKSQLDVILICSDVLVKGFSNYRIVVRSIEKGEPEPEVVKSENSSSFVSRRYIYACTVYDVPAWINGNGGSWGNVRTICDGGPV